MRPSSSEIVTRIRQAIDADVLPHVDHKLAASSLRSARVLLDHLASRLEHEAAFLSEDNADARAVLDKAVSMLGGDEAAAIEAATAAVSTDPAEANEDYQRALEIAVAASHRAADKSLHREIRAYLTRRLERERGMFYPAFTAPPF